MAQLRLQKYQSQQNLDLSKDGAAIGHDSGMIKTFF